MKPEHEADISISCDSDVLKSDAGTENVLTLRQRRRWEKKEVKVTEREHSRPNYVNVVCGD